MMGFTREEIDGRMDNILEFADIGDFVYQPVKTYSSGMFVRLAFAVAINIDPEILIVDEALSVGDVFFQAKCYQKFEEFKKEGKTILFVSHDLGSISKYCDRVVLLNKGKKMEEGTPKEMINLYKKLLTTSSGIRDREQQLQKKVTIKKDIVGECWKKNFVLNPKMDEYGDGKAEIIDFAIVDNNGNLTNAIQKGTRFKLMLKVRFNEPIQEPIFTYTFKTVRGIDVTGTNTMIENQDVGICNSGEVYVVSFEQEMNLQGGEYLLSMSCTGYEKGELKAHHRMYDLVNVTVISDKNTVGFYDMNSKINIEKVNK